jgi:hypothetical protein
LLVEIDRDDGLVRIAVEADRRNPPDRHARALHGRARLEPADIVELELDRVGCLERQRAHVAGLQREKQQRHETQHHEQADPEVESSLFHRHPKVNPPRRRRSPPRAASDAPRAGNVPRSLS